MGPNDTIEIQKHKAVVITGASSGIGRATALAFAKHHASLVLIARNEAALREVAGQCEKLGGRARFVNADVADENALKQAARKAVESFGKIDVWFNDAAVTLFGRFEDIPSDAFRRVIETNLFGYVNGARAALPQFRAQGHGVLINMSSLAGRIGQPYTSPYNASKFAVNGLSESLREELMDMPNIHVCTVIAPSTDTPLFQHGANYTGRAVKPMQPIYPAELVAQTIVNLSDHPRREFVIGNAGKQLVFLARMIPGRLEKIMARKVEKDHFQKKSAVPGSGNLFHPLEQIETISGGWSRRNGASSFARRVGMALGVAGLGAGVLGYAFVRGINPFRARKRALFGRGG